EEVDACAPPVTVSAGASGMTPVAVAPPALRTVTETAKPCPRVTLAGTEMEVICSAAGACTAMVFEEICAAEHGDNEFASCPAAPARSCSVPGAAPFSWNVQANVALEPPAMSTAEADASAAPLFASVPTAAPVNESVPEPLPVSWKVQLKVALWPPASVIGACNEVVEAEAPPVAATAGDAGEGRTCAAEASPVF